MIATDNNAIIVLNDYINDYITIAATRVLRACVDVNGNRSSTAATATTTATTIIITDVIIEAAVVIPIVAIIVDGV